MAVAPIVQWENFLSVRPSIVCCRTWQAGPEAKQAGSKAWQAGPKAWQDGPEVWLAGPLAWLAGPEVWLAGPETLLAGSAWLTGWVSGQPKGHRLTNVETGRQTDSMDRRA